jgi:hypothetical protein
MKSPRFLRVSSNYYSFLSGIFVSVGISFLTGVLSLDQLPHKWPFLVASGGLTVLSSIAWAIVAWALASIERLTIENPMADVHPNVVWDTLATAKRGTLLLSFGAALLFAVLGIGVLALGYRPQPSRPKHDRHAQVQCPQGVGTQREDTVDHPTR